MGRSQSVYTFQIRARLLRHRWQSSSTIMGEVLLRVIWKVTTHFFAHWQIAGAVSSFPGRIASLRRVHIPPRTRMLGLLSDGLQIMLPKSEPTHGGSPLAGVGPGRFLLPWVRQQGKKKSWALVFKLVAIPT